MIRDLLRDVPGVFAMILIAVAIAAGVLGVVAGIAASVLRVIG